jgi:holin-like protein
MTGAPYDIGMAIFGIPYPKLSERPAAGLVDRVLALAASLAVLVALAFAGGELAAIGRLPVPGPVLGAALLVVLLALRPRWATALPAADALIAWLPLFFVPLIVGGAGALRALGPAVGPVAVVILVSTAAGIVGTALAGRALTWLCSRSA